MTDKLVDLSRIVRDEFLHLMCGSFIGEGSARVVYNCTIDPNLVIKIEDHSGSFQNVIEWETWQEVKHTKYSKWFAPCKFISHSGSVLVQQKATSLVNKKLPERLPSFFTDIKPSNFGYIGKQFVAVDYGLHCMISTALTDKTRKAIWYD